MDVDALRNLSLDTIREEYKKYLNNIEGIGDNTRRTAFTDSFYLWRREGKDCFWDTVLSDDFEETAKMRLTECLRENSSGNVDSLVSGYLSHLRRFRSFVLEDSTDVSVVDDYQVLKDFLLDIDCLEPLAEYTEKMNIFDVLKITKTEIRHSNMLEWLMSPNENHGLGTSVIKAFVQYATTAFPDSSEAFDNLLMDFHEFEIMREWMNIDIVAISHSQKYVLCIENKIDTGEHDSQLMRYRKTIEENFPDYRRQYIFLSPEGIESREPDIWCSMSYQDVLRIIENARKKAQLLPDADLLISNYIEAVRRDIVGDEKLARICAKIYAEHQRALDLIYENKPDRAADIAAIFRKWAQEKDNKGELHVDLEKSIKTYTRFTTDTMTSILPEMDEAVSGWSSKTPYFYEIVNNQGKEFGCF